MINYVADISLVFYSSLISFTFSSVADVGVENVWYSGNTAAGSSLSTSTPARCSSMYERRTCVSRHVNYIPCQVGPQITL